VGTLLKKFTPYTGGRKKWIFLTILLIALAIGGFFVIRHFFFNPPSLEEGFAVWTEVTASDDFRSLDAELYTGGHEENFVNRLNFYFNGEVDEFNRTFVGIMSGFSSTDAAVQARVHGVANNVVYVRERFAIATYVYIRFGDYADYISKNLLFLPNTNVTRELEAMIAQKNAVLRARTQLVNFMDVVERNFITIEPEQLTDPAVFSQRLNEVTLRYYGPVVTKFLNYVRELIHFANLANDIILAGADDLGAMSYRNSLYNIGLTFLYEIVRAEALLPETHAAFFEGEHNTGAGFLNRMFVREIYQGFNARFLENTLSDAEMILAFENVSTHNFRLTNIQEIAPGAFLPGDSITLFNIQTSKRIIVEGLRQVNLTQVIRHSFEIATEIVTADQTVTIISPYLASLNTTQRGNVTRVFTLLFGEIATAEDGGEVTA